MKHSKKILALAIAGALAVPQTAFAAEDTSGMHYTSASEGFYVSMRAQFDSSGDSKAPTVGSGGSRFGVRGTNDLGGGLEGFYQYEAGVTSAEQGGGLGTRLGNVGLRGKFGEIVAGAFWHNSYNWTYAGLDVANWYSASTAGSLSQYRTSKTIQYTSPEFNGVQFSAHGQFDNSVDGDGAINAANPEDDDAIDEWTVSAKYGIQGFSFGGTYIVKPGSLHGTPADDADPDDLTAFAGKIGYAQDNWYVNGFYGTNNASDGTDITDAAGTVIPAPTDNTVITGGAGGVSVGKTSLYGIFESSAFGDQTFTYTTAGAQYNLGSNSRVYIEYYTRGGTTADGEDIADDDLKDDIIAIGLRHDF